jgi:hypothetical protein
MSFLHQRFLQILCVPVSVQHDVDLLGKECKL